MRIQLYWRRQRQKTVFTIIFDKQGIDASARKPALIRNTGYMVEKPYHDIAPYLRVCVFNASVTHIWFKRWFQIQKLSLELKKKKSFLFLMETNDAWLVANIPTVIFFLLRFDLTSMYTIVFGCFPRPKKCHSLKKKKKKLNPNHLS